MPVRRRLAAAAARLPSGSGLSRRLTCRKTRAPAVRRSSAGRRRARGLGKPRAQRLTPTPLPAVRLPPSVASAGTGKARLVQRLTLQIQLAHLACGPSMEASSSDLQSSSPLASPPQMLHFARRLTNRWEASLWLNGRQLYLGGFNTEADAAHAYDLVRANSKLSLSKTCRTSRLLFTLMHISTQLPPLLRQRSHHHAWSLTSTAAQVALSCKGLHVATNFDQATYAGELAAVGQSSQVSGSPGPGSAGLVCTLTFLIAGLLELTNARGALWFMVMFAGGDRGIRAA